MSRLTSLFVAAACLAIPGTSATHLAAVPAEGPEISATRIRADLEFLADDLLEGREAGTRGYDMAARYTASVLRAAGYEPAGDDGTYFQQVPLIETTAGPSSIHVTVGGKTARLTAAEALAGASSAAAEREVSAPAVFAGYGVTAPDFGHDDYAGLDVTGKIVAVLYGGPPRLPSEPRAHYSGEHKARNAADHGAVGLVTLLRESDLKTFTWDQVRAVFGRPSLTWARADGTPGTSEPRLRGGALLHPSASARLFAGAPVSFADAAAQADAGKGSGVTLDASLAITSSATHRRTSSPNVVAKLPGSDPSLAATSVVLSAHLDHTGVNPDGEGDRINNGFYDNAMGTAIVLEVARVLAAQPVRPKRSIVVVLVTAEEKGLIGSDYFARHPGAPAGRLVANVNLDMPLFLAASKDLVAFGSENSTLDAVVRQAVTALGYSLSPDPMPQENLFVRSDQYSFVKQGVPAVYLMPGFTAADAAVNGQQVVGGFLAQHYHKPSDDLTLPMDQAAVVKFTRANLAIARAIADDAVDPTWKPGNFFGKVFGKKD